jgi:hypothetical protein
LSTQSYNRYSYVSNRPLTWIDPDGFEDVPVGVVVTGDRLPCFECPASMDSMSARSLIQSFVNQFIFRGRQGLGGVTAESERQRHADPDRGKNFGNGDSEGSWSGTDTKAVGMTAVHLALGAASLSEIPLVSQGAGLTDAVISLVEGDWKGAGLSAAGILPGVGAVADTANLARRGGKLVEASKSLGANPFAGKTTKEVGQMLEKKGYIPKGPDPVAGRGTYVNPQTGRGYHIDANHPAPKGPHVGVHRPRDMRDTLETRDYSMGGP